MPLEVRRQARESSQALIRRFTQKLGRSGILIKARRRRFRSRPKSDEAKKRRALRAQELKKEYLKLGKLGQLPDRHRAGRRRR